MKRRGALAGPVTSGQWQLTQLGRYHWRLTRSRLHLEPVVVEFWGTTSWALGRLKQALEDERYRANLARQWAAWRRTQAAGHREGRHVGTIDGCPRCQKFKAE